MSYSSAQKMQHVGLTSACQGSTQHLRELCHRYISETETLISWKALACTCMAVLLKYLQPMSCVASACVSSFCASLPPATMHVPFCRSAMQP